MYCRAIDDSLQVSAEAGGDTGAPQVKVNPIDRGIYHTDWVADRTIDWLDSLDADDDWFCWMSFPDPHHPWDPPESEVGRVDWREVPLPAGYPEDRATREAIIDGKPRHWRAWYDGSLVSNYEAPADWVPATLTADQVREVNARNAVEVELIDEALGRVLARVAERGWGDDVDVVFTTDHGELQGDFGLLFKGPYHVDGLMRLPLVWRPAPSARAAGADRRVGRHPSGRPRRPGPHLLRHRRDRPAGVDAGHAAAGRRRRRRVPRLRQGPDRVGQRAVRRRRPPPHHDPRPVGGHHLPARHQPRRHRGRAVRPGGRSAAAGQPVGRCLGPAAPRRPGGRPVGLPARGPEPSAWSSRPPCDRRGRRRLLVRPLARRGRRPPPAGRPGGRQPGARHRRAARPSTSCPGPTRWSPWSSPGTRARSSSSARHGPRRDLLGRADRPRHPGAGGRLGAAGRRPDVAGRPRRPRQRLAVRGVRQPRPPPVPGPRRPGHRRAPPPPALQQLRDPARRDAGDQGLRRLAAPGPRSRPTSGSPASWWPWSRTGSPSSTGSSCPSRPSPGSRRTVATCTWWATPACCGSGGTGGSGPTPRSGPRTGPEEGQTYGWDCVLALGAAWFLDDGDGSTNFDGSFRDKGISTAPLQLIRVDLASAAGVRGRRSARRDRRAHHQSPDRGRRPADRRGLRQRQRGHGRLRHRRGRRPHPAVATRPRPRRPPAPAPRRRCAGDRGPRPGADGRTGGGARHRHRRRAGPGRHGGPLQSAVFPALGWDATVYWCSLSTVSRLRFG